MDAIFKFSGLMILPFWALMILLPRWRWTLRIMRSPYTSAAAAVEYAVLVLPRLGAIWPAVSRPTLEGIAALLGSSAGATNVVVISFIVEMTAIITQAARGTTSHFNMTTPFNSLVWMTMGTFIGFVWLVTLLLAVLLIRQQLPDPAFAWSLRLGVLISVVGMSVAFLMVRPTPAQVAALTTLHGPHIIGAHSVGIPDGGPGLPFLGGAPWRATCGPHISSGYTALQLLPFLGWLLARQRVSAFLGERRRLTLVWTGGLAYLGLVLLLVWQALRGQSVIHPDGTTLVAAGRWPQPQPPPSWLTSLTP